MQFQLAIEQPAGTASMLAALKVLPRSQAHAQRLNIDIDSSHETAHPPRNPHGMHTGISGKLVPCTTPKGIFLVRQIHGQKAPTQLIMSPSRG